MKILVANHDNFDLYLDISTPTKELDAYMYMFLLNKYQMGYYIVSEMDEKMKDLYYRAINGDKQSAKSFIWSRKKYEYEGFSLEELKNPTKALKEEK